VTFSKGTTPTISANGTNNGILWALNVDPYASSGAAVLYAFDATNLSRLLYSSAQNSTRDVPGTAVHFTLPTVANGKVYVPAVRQVSVFGNAVFFPQLAAGRLNQGEYDLILAGQTNSTYILQASSNFVNWVPVATNVPGTTQFTLADTNASNHTSRFYRAVLASP